MVCMEKKELNKIAMEIKSLNELKEWNFNGGNMFAVVFTTEIYYVLPPVWFNWQNINELNNNIMNTIINNENSLTETVEFLKKYFENVRVITNENSALASKSQNFYTIILFENRGVTFSIKWNYYNCTLYFGNITISKKPSLQYSFTKMKLDNCYPIEELNNNNVVFWMYEITEPHDDMSGEISPLRLPITVQS